MRILEIVCNYLGTELYKNLFSVLPKDQIQPAVFVPVAQDTVVPENLAESVTACPCFSKNDRFFFPVKHRKIMRGISASFPDSNFSVLHAHTLFTDGTVALDLHEKFGTPYLVAVRNTDVNVFFKHMFWLRGTGIKVMKNAYRVIFLSEAYRKFVIEQYVPHDLQKEISEKSLVIPNGINPIWLEHPAEPKKQVDKKKISIIYSGRIEKNKNCRTTVEACKHLIQKGYDVTYTVVGKITEPEYFKEFSEEPFVRHIEAQPFDKLIALYKTQDVFVMPSFAETFGLAYAEALTQGLPIIYSRGQGFDGQFPEGTVGYGVKSDDAAEIAEKIEQILENYESISKACLEGGKRYNWQSIAKSYTDLYEAACCTSQQKPQES